MVAPNLNLGQPSASESPAVAPRGYVTLYAQTEADARASGQAFASPGAQGYPEVAGISGVAKP